MCFKRNSCTDRRTPIQDANRTPVCSLRRHDGSGLAHGDEARLLVGIVWTHAPGCVASSTQLPGGHHLEELRHNSGDNGGNQTDAPDGAPPSRERKEALDTVA